MKAIHPTILLLIFGPVFAGCPDDEPSTPTDGGIPLPDATVEEEDDGGVRERELAPLVDVCPRGDAPVVIGDTNGDGVSDIGDVVALQNHLFRRGPGPVCPAAANFDGDSRVELDDSERVTMWLLTGKQIPRVLGERECESPDYWPEGQCAPLALDLLAPLRVTESTFTVEVALRSPTLEVHGYSLSLETTDCELGEVSTDGTTAAEVWDRPRGKRHLGWATTPRVEGGAIAYIILSGVEDITFAKSRDPVPVLSAEINAVLPESGCRICRIALIDGLIWKGQPINTMIAAASRSYVPALPNIEVEVCAE
jgi:hypothetical protein